MNSDRFVWIYVYDFDHIKELSYFPSSLAPTFWLCLFKKPKSTCKTGYISHIFAEIILFFNFFLGISYLSGRLLLFSIFFIVPAPQTMGSISRRFDTSHNFFLRHGFQVVGHSQRGTHVNEKASQVVCVSDELGIPVVPWKCVVEIVPSFTNSQPRNEWICLSRCEIPENENIW